MESVTLLELNQFIRQIMTLNFPDPIWVQAEIAQVSLSKGHYYIELWQKDGTSETTLAKASCILWARDFAALKRAHGKALKEVLQEGIEVKISVEVGFHEQFGHRLHIRDIDPIWTFGQQAIKRRKTVEALTIKGLLDKNKMLPLPKVLQRIAVISSENAAGLEDFVQHLRENAFRYTFDLTLFSSAVQGQNVLPDVERALKNIRNLISAFDCVAIIRGGGARTDLTAFDHLDLCARVAQMPLPVLVGIGHQTDESVLDLVAFRSLKTPTAVADYLITHNQFFEGNILETVREIQHTALNLVQEKLDILKENEQNIGFFAQKNLQKANFTLNMVEGALQQTVKACLQNAAYSLWQKETLLTALDPQTILKRGYSLTTSSGKTVTSPKAVKSGDLIKTHTKDGAFDSVAS